MSDAARLHSIIVVDVITTLVATTFMLVMQLTVVQSGYLVVLTVAVAAVGCVVASALVPLRRGQIDRALFLLAAPNWAIAIVAAVVATFSWPLMVWTAMIPTLLAASLISGHRLAAYVTTSVVVSIGVVLLGLLQDFSGLSAELDEWVKDSILIITAPGLVAMAALMAWQNNKHLKEVLAAVRASRAELAEQADELRRSRSRVVAATDRERRRIERDLHDGAQQRLIGIGIGMSRARALVDSDSASAGRLLDTLREELRYAHDEVRDLAQGVYPPVLTEHGLEAALQSAADRSPIPVTISLDPLGRHPADTEAALYFCCVEAMQNAAKHSAATSLLLSGGVVDAALWVAVSDDGTGLEPTEQAAGGEASDGEPTGSGIIGMRDRLGAIGGVLEVTSTPGRGTVVRCQVPTWPV